MTGHVRGHPAPGRPAGWALWAIAVLFLATLPALAAEPAAPAATAKPAKTKPATGAKAPPKSASLGEGKSSGPMLTRDELRQCMATQGALKERRTSLESRLSAMELEKAELLAAGDTLKGELDTLDRTSAEAVESYNARARSRDERVDQWNGRNKQLVAEADVFKSEQNQWEADCGNRRYREDDEIAIKRGK